MAGIVDTLKQVQKALHSNTDKIVAEAVSNSTAPMTQLLDKIVIQRSISEYYNEYDPSIYKRTYSFYDIFTPQVTASGGHALCKAQGGASTVAPHSSRSLWHQSGGKWISRFENPDFNFNSSANGIPETEWIYANLLAGIHPGTSCIGEPLVDRISNHIEEFAIESASIVFANVIRSARKYF